MHICTCFTHISYYKAQAHAAQNKEQEDIGSTLDQHLERYFYNFECFLIFH
jgi:hypothetical protein